MCNFESVFRIAAVLLVLCAVGLGILIGIVFAVSTGQLEGSTFYTGVCWTLGILSLLGVGIAAKILI